LKLIKGLIIRDHNWVLTGLIGSYYLIFFKCFLRTVLIILEPVLYIY
jgi:hypothetical protein